MYFVTIQNEFFTCTMLSMSLCCILWYWYCVWEIKNIGSIGSRLDLGTLNKGKHPVQFEHLGGKNGGHREGVVKDLGQSCSFQEELCGAQQVTRHRELAPDACRLANKPGTTHDSSFCIYRSQDYICSSPHSLCS